MDISKKKSLSFKNKLGLLFFFGLFFCEDLSAQIKGISLLADSTSTHTSTLNFLDAHIGWSNQKYLYAGVQVDFIRLDWGYDIFGANEHSHSLSGSLFWIFEEDSSKELWSDLSGSTKSQSLISVCYTAQYLNNFIVHYVMANIGLRWLPNFLDYMLSGGMGIEFSSRAKTKFFFGFDLSIGYNFFFRK
jgi:hypothetical protein